jgi:dihydrofolate synthase/folylpolyglutamate synthase
MTIEKLLKKQSLKQWLQRLETQHNKKIDLGLERVNQVYINLQLDKISPVIITVAGTNGKGSTVAILSALLQQAGYSVGEFTSPHILHFNERIKISGHAVTDDEIVTAFEVIENNLDGISLSYFEYATLAAAYIFKTNLVDVSILEVGLGGRLDSVNAIDSDCAIITTIDIDHTHFLGNDIESIAFEKAGIMRKNKPVIYGDINCPKAIIEHAQAISADLMFSNEFDTNKYDLPNIKGEFQLLNAATAIKAIEALEPNINVTLEQLNKGLRTIQLEGRLQIISTLPDIYVDVSHNKQAAVSLSIWLKNNSIKGQTIAVFAVLDDKKPIEWLDVFKDSISVWCISQVDSDRTMTKQKLLSTLSQSAQLILSFDSVTQAYKKAQIICNKNDRIIVFGSFYTVSEVMACE